jgi:predicted ribonuclease YlaK
MDQLIELMDEGKLPTNLADGFDPQQFIEVKTPETTADVKSQEDAVVEAVQVLNHLATLKVKMQESREEAMQARQLIDLLFTDEPMSEEQLASLKDGFKTLKSFAQSNLKYKDARSQAETARQVLDEALKP